MLIQKIDETTGKEFLGKIAESELDSSLQTKVNNTAPTGTFKQTLTYNEANELISTNVLEIMDTVAEKKVSVFEIINAWKRINAIKDILIQGDAGGTFLTLSNSGGDLYIKKTTHSGSYTFNINLNGAETTEGTILVRQSDGTFKFKNISNYLGSITGVKVLRLPFDKATLNESDLSFPIGTRLLRMSVKVTTALVGSLSAISLQGSSPLTIALEFADYLQGVGTYNIDLMNLPELDSSLVGKLRLSQPGSGTGTGIIYLEYITSMES